MKSSSFCQWSGRVGKLMLSISVVCLLISIQACNSGATSDHQDSVDSAKAVNKEVKPVGKDASDFAVQAANGGAMEVEMGKLAQEKAVSQRVKDFGSMMVKDHTEAGQNLKSIATNLNIALPDSLDNDAMKEMDMLKKKKGKDFDKAYVSMMLDDHKKDIADFRKCADDCSDSSIKAFASNTLPVLEKHLDSIQAISGKK
jgi:putative membrane protein